MATQVLEGTWEEVARHAKNLIGRKVRVTVLDDEVLPKPNLKALEIINKVSENQKNRKETYGESSVDIIRRGRAGEMFNDDSNE
jgi:hypothetical protein